MGLCRRSIPNYPDGIMNEPRTGNRVADRGCPPTARGDNGRVLRSRYGPAHSHQGNGTHTADPTGQSPAGYPPSTRAGWSTLSVLFIYFVCTITRITLYHACITLYHTVSATPRITLRDFLKSVSKNVSLCIIMYHVVSMLITDTHDTHPIQTPIRHDTIRYGVIQSDTSVIQSDTCDSIVQTK